MFSIDDLASMTAGIMFDDPYDMDEDMARAWLYEAFTSDDPPHEPALSAVVWMIKNHPSYSDHVRDTFIAAVSDDIISIYGEDDEDEPGDDDGARLIALRGN